MGLTKKPSKAFHVECGVHYAKYLDKPRYFTLFMQALLGSNLKPVGKKRAGRPGYIKLFVEPDIHRFNAHDDYPPEVYQEDRRYILYPIADIAMIEPYTFNTLIYSKHGGHIRTVESYRAIQKRWDHELKK